MKNSILKKGIILVLIAVLSVLPMTGCGGSESDSGNGGASDSETTYTIKLGQVMDTEHSYQAGCVKFKELLEEKSGGRITVEVYPNSQLGGEREMMEGMQLGTIEMAMSGTSAVSGIVPDWKVFDLPYLFTNYDEAFAVYESEVGTKLLESSVSQGVRGLAYGNMGFRSVYSSKGPIEKVEDLKGLKIRTMESPIPIATFKSLGAAPVSMAYPEVYSALEQGVMDAAENSVSALFTSKHYETSPYFSITKHNLIPVVLFISEKFYQSLPEDLKTMVDESAHEAMTYQRQVQMDNDDKSLEKLKEAGVAVNFIDDVTPFEEKVRPVWDENINTIPNGPENLEAILKIVDEVRGK